MLIDCFVCFFFFNDTATTEIYTLSLHDALPISRLTASSMVETSSPDMRSNSKSMRPAPGDRKSTRLNSSHEWNSYDVFCLKKKMNAERDHIPEVAVGNGKSGQQDPHPERRNGKHHYFY